jgi:hypothetical protein
VQSFTIPGVFAATVQQGDRSTIAGAYVLNRQWWQFGKARPYEQRWWHRLQFWRPTTDQALQRFSVVKAVGSTLFMDSLR